MITIALDDSWDMQLDASGNFVVLEGNAAIVQSVANAVKLFRGEPWFDTQSGRPWLADTLGHRPPDQVVISHLEAAALTVPGVAAARAELLEFDQEPPAFKDGIQGAGRALRARIYISTDTGESLHVTV